MGNPQDEAIRAQLPPRTKIEASLETPPSPELRDMLVELLRDDSKYEIFSSDPSGYLKSSGLQAFEDDASTIASLAEFIHDKKASRARAAEDLELASRSKSTEATQQYNWDHSASWFTLKESAWWRTRGRSWAKNIGSEKGVSKKFDTEGVGWVLDSILRDEVDAVFFPTQPLISPVLLDKILAALEE